MDKNAAANRGLWGALEAMIVGFVVAGAAAAVLLTNFNGQGRLWDKLLGRADDFGTPSAAIVTRAQAPDPGDGHMLLVADAPQAEKPYAVEARSAPKPAPAKKSWVKHISGQLAAYSITGPASQHSSASAGAEAAPSAPAAVSAAPAAAVAAVQAPAPAPAAPAASPSYVNYGSSSRSDIMSSASGPVYNFSGKKK